MTKKLSLCVLFVLAICAVSSAQMQTTSSQQPSASPAPGTPLTISIILDRSLSNAEREFVPAADAMPEDKYTYAPTNGEFKGVRNFGEQVRHVAATNYLFGSVLLAEKAPVDLGKDNDSGPANMTSKAEIMKYLRDSFEYLHRAVKTVKADNATGALNAPWGGKPSRLGLAVLSIAHPFDHYGQMVEYLRANGIIPPASRPQQR
jgi:uncharacterized damage-inducible protein DinB